MDPISAGERAEHRVFEVLKSLPSPWQFFPTVEWRLLQRDGESVGEADVVVFHPQQGLIVIEIKSGAISIQNGTWFYASGLAMKQSPFSQARRNRFALIDKLRNVLGNSADELTVTHAVWFPDVVWKGPFPGTEAPSKAFLLDSQSLSSPESALMAIFGDAVNKPVPWSRSQQQMLKRLLAPDCNLLVPLSVHIDDTLSVLQTATDQQIQVLRMLRTQSRLLIEGGAGTGKTLLACALAREHAALGKSVLLTCFNRQLASHLSACLADLPTIHVIPFHELSRQQAHAAGLSYTVPEESEEQQIFFRETSPEILLNASEITGQRFDTIIVDEAADFGNTWWIALEALGSEDFSWYCFYDRQQTIYKHDEQWQPPFSAIPFVLDINLRNPRPVGEFAARIGHCPSPSSFRVESGIAPQVQISGNFAEMSRELVQLLKDLQHKESIGLERIVVLAPYRHDNAHSHWAGGLSPSILSTNLSEPEKGKLRIGTIQAFKGLEADVVILAGIDHKSSTRPELLYVGASRARAALYVLALKDALPSF